MKLLIPLAVTALMLAGCGQEQTTSTPPQSSETSTAVLTAAGEQTVELSCATCIYKMSDVAGCKLAAKVAGQAMLVDGPSIDLHEHNLCSGTTQAKVVGKVESGKFIASNITIE